MNYELAEELKEAGFPQDGKGFRIHDNVSVPSRHYYIPTLDELIESCGDRFYTLEKAGVLGWRAHSNEYNFYCDGSTPKAAVALLWLALHPKV